MLQKTENVKVGKSKIHNGFVDLFTQINKYVLPSFFSDFNRKSESLDAELSCHLQIFDSSSLLSISDLNGNIIFVNDKFCTVSKYSREELLGKPHSIIRHPDTPGSVFKELWFKIAKGEIWQGEIKNIAKDGSAFWVSSTIVPVLGPNGKPIKYINMRIDITHQKKIEDELRETKKLSDFGLFENVNYAKHVHGSLLTNEDEIRCTFPNSFLISKAQKIISGDFYGIYFHDNKSIIVIGDSTGHGVSASYISILALNILESTLKKGIVQPDEILKIMHSEMFTITNKKKEMIESADTMICSIDHGSNVLNYSSAKMRGVIIRNNEIIELKRDKFSIGEYSSRLVQFSNHTFQLELADCLYLFSDGIVDQFGGPNDKKFGYKNLQKLLLANHKLSMESQKNQILNSLNDWQCGFEQTDDMTLLGISNV